MATARQKPIEATRRLVEDDAVLMMYGSVGTPTNAAAEKYLNQKKIPQLFITTGASRFREPSSYPWTMAFIPSYIQEGRAMARFVLDTVTSPRIAIFYQNDDLGKDFRAEFRSGLGDKANSLIVSEQTYEVTDPAVDSQLIAAKVSGANASISPGHKGPALNRSAASASSIGRHCILSAASPATSRRC